MRIFGDGEREEHKRGRKKSKGTRWFKCTSTVRGVDGRQRGEGRLKRKLYSGQCGIPRAIQLFLLSPDDASGQPPFGPSTSRPSHLFPCDAVGTADASNFIIPSRRTDSPFLVPFSHPALSSSRLPAVYFRAKRSIHEGAPDWCALSMYRVLR